MRSRPTRTKGASTARRRRRRSARRRARRLPRAAPAPRAPSATAISLRSAKTSPRAISATTMCLARARVVEAPPWLCAPPPLRGARARARAPRRSDDRRRCRRSGRRATSAPEVVCVFRAQAFIYRGTDDRPLTRARARAGRRAGERLADGTVVWRQGRFLRHGRGSRGVLHPSRNDPRVRARARSPPLSCARVQRQRPRHTLTPPTESLARRPLGSVARL